VQLLIVHRLELSAGLEALLSDRLVTLEHAVSALTEKLDALEAAVVKAEAETAGDVAHLQAQITELRAAVEAGTATPEDLARLDALTARIAAIDPDPSFPPTPPVE
jgi:uncharacterized coiled-coil protein SlyX